MRNKKLLWILAIPLLLVSCWNPKDFEKFAIDPIPQSWVLPVLKSTITFKEMVERSSANTIVEEGPGGVYFMAFRDTMDIAGALDEFQLTGANFNFSLNYPLASGFGQVTSEQDFNQTYEIVSGSEIKLIDLLTGTMNLSMVNNYHHRVLGTFTIYSLENNQVVYSRVFNLATFSSSVNDIVSLNDYTLSLFDADADSYNTFMVGISFTFQENISAPTYDGSLEIGISFTNPDFEMIVGKFNKQVSIPDQAYSIGAFNSTIFAEQHFAEPYFDFYIQNSYGVPIGFTFIDFTASNNSGDELLIVNTGVPGPDDINLSGVNPVGFPLSPSLPPVLTKLSLNHTNSNIDDIFDIAPNKLNFGADFFIGDDSHERFIRRDSRINFISDLSIPLYGWAVTHELHDTIMDMPWPDIKNEFDFLKDDYIVTLKFKVNNEIPLNMRFQLVTLVDTEDGIVRDYYLFNDESDPEGAVFLTESADINPTTGHSIGSRSSYLTLRLTKDEYDQVYGSDHLLIMYWLSTGGAISQDVKVLSTNKLAIQISLLVSGTLEFNLPDWFDFDI